MAGAPTPSPESDEGKAAGRAVDYRITGFWLWRTAVVPPNVHVSHTRRGHEKPMAPHLADRLRPPGLACRLMLRHRPGKPELCRLYTKTNGLGRSLHGDVFAARAKHSHVYATLL